MVAWGWLVVAFLCGVVSVAVPMIAMWRDFKDDDEVDDNVTSQYESTED